MLIHIHRQTISRYHTVSELRFPGGTLHVVEPPLAGFSAFGPRALLPGEHNLYVKPLMGLLRPCFPKHGEKYRYYLAPMLLRTHVDDVSFDCPYTDHTQLRPLYAGVYDDEGFVQPDLELWEKFVRTVEQASRRHECIKVSITI